MPIPLHVPHARRAGIILAAGAAFAAVPAAAFASPVGLGTSAPFVVLGGSAVTNTGPSVLNGDLGVAPGTSLVGFALPAVVNGATHNNDAVAAGAQNDLTTAYNVAAGQPVTSDLTGQDLGGLTLTAGAYRYATSAQLTGQLTLDAQGDPNAQFVFEIGSTLTTASASSVRMINGASPCNVFWQVGSSATLGTTTALAGNVLALTSITLNHAATVQGRVLARNGAVTLDDNVLDATACNASPAPTPTPTPTAGPTAAPTTATPPTTPGATPPGTPTTVPAPPTQTGQPTPTPTAGGTPTGPGTTPSSPGDDHVPPASDTTITTRRGTASLYPRLPNGCTTGFRAAVRGHMIERVVFTLAGRQIAVRTHGHFHVYVRPSAGSRGKLRAHVVFTNGTHAKTMKFTYRACAAAVLHPALGPSKFTG
jgi:hypothetical protein